MVLLVELKQMKILKALALSHYEKIPNHQNLPFSD